VTPNGLTNEVSNYVSFLLQLIHSLIYVSFLSLQSNRRMQDRQITLCKYFVKTRCTSGRHSKRFNRLSETTHHRRLSSRSSLQTGQRRSGTCLNNNASRHFERYRLTYSTLLSSHAINEFLGSNALRSSKVFRASLNIFLKLSIQKVENPDPTKLHSIK